jgi:hypothetical protein
MISALQALHMLPIKCQPTFLYIGLIHSLLPNATIVHVHRDPLDTCASIYARLFRNDMPFAYSLENLACYYNQYQQLMAYWRALLPAGAFLDLAYEDLVQNQQQTTKALLNFCQLPWHEACLSPHKTQRLINTASFDQVRRPIYTSSIGQWRRYNDLYTPLGKMLADGDC